MTNFDYLKDESQFNGFSDIAIVAEKTLGIDANTCILNCRRAMEMAIKWMYSVDRDLTVPYQDNLSSLMNSKNFRDIIDSDLLKRLNFIRKYGNAAAHNSKKQSFDVAKLCLTNLFYFMDFISCCYAEHYEQRDYNDSLLEQKNEIKHIETIPYDADLATLIEENKKLKSELSARRRKQQQTYNPKPLDLSEYETRKLYIDAMLLDAGWTKGTDWQDEVPIKGVQNKSATGYADYVLYDDAYNPLAIIEAKNTCTDEAVGRNQAEQYAEMICKQVKRKPIIFLTNGFSTRIIDNQYPERKVSSIYSKRDLEKLFNLQRMKSHLNYIIINKEIAGRYYQEAAIKAVCEVFNNNRRKALLAMATGSGKTRTMIGLVDVLLQNGWVRNILFLADRNALVTQAKRGFLDFLPDLSATNLVEDKENYNAHIVFSTYQTMISCIDTIKENGKKLYTCGHFDLMICDEAHRSIYNKYQEIFTYFDAPLVGLTATPKAEVGRNTYEIFDLENGVPTYGYDLEQAVKDKFLVDYLSIETNLKLMEQGIVYDDLTEDEKEVYENTFIDEEGNHPASINPSEMNSKIFNKDTIKKALHIFMKNGLKIDYGQKIGKTIIFAKNHKHAEAIYEVFNTEFPELKDYAMIIDNYSKFTQNAIDTFSDIKKLPQIAISVDMLDTGIDVPEILNLVFFKKVLSKAKFWQMIGRGTRTCPYLLDGKDKTKFYIFDFCGNFEFFRMSNGNTAEVAIPVHEALFNLQFQIAWKLQMIDYQTEELQAFRKSLVDEMTNKVLTLDKTKFTVKQHLRYVVLYSEAANYSSLTYEDTLHVKSEVAPLIKPCEEDISANRFDALMYGIELAYLAGVSYSKKQSDLLKKVGKLAKYASIDEIRVQSDLIKKIIRTSFLDDCGINEFEDIRKRLRNLIKYLPKEERAYDTDFQDDILSSKWNKAELKSDELRNYKAKVEYYIRQHQKDNVAIVKLKSNEPLNADDVAALEHVLWKELGTRQEYYSEIGEKPLGEFVRSIVGLDMNSAKKAFADYLNSSELNANQIYFVNLIVEYIVRNGVMRDLSVLKDSPFIDKGSVVDIFTDMTIWNGIRQVIDNINDNAVFF